MVEGGTVIDAVVLVENVGVEARVHAFARTAGTEASTASEEDLERGEGIDVVIMDTEAFESDVDVGEFEVLLRNVELAAGVV